MTNQITNVAQSLNMTEKELLEYIQTISRVLNENFMKDVLTGVMSYKDAFEASVKLWDKKLKDMSMQLLSERVESSGVTHKMGLFADALLDTVYERFNA